jgi:homoserine kinase
VALSETSARLATCTAFAPATVANLGVGFDILGLALRHPGDRVTARMSETPGVQIEAITGDGGRLPRAAERNTAGIAAASTVALLRERGIGVQGVSLRLAKGLPLASGLGSSAASAVAAAVAVNGLFGSPLTTGELLSACLDGEAAVSGRHADNVAPALFGGITLCLGTEADDIRALPVPANLYLALVTPHVEVPTAQARAVLPAQVPLKQMVAQTGAVAQVVDALYRGDLAALADAMQRDQVIEPARASLMPLLTEARLAARRAGALGLVISGAGPSLCAVCDAADAAQRVAAALGALYAEAGIGGDAFATEPGAGAALR